MKVPVRNHMSILDAETVARVRRAQAGGRDVPSGGASGPSAPAAGAPARGKATAVDAEKVRQSAFLQASYGSEIKGVRVIRAPRADAASVAEAAPPPQAPPGKAPLQAPAGEKAAAKGVAKAPERPAAKKPAEVRPEAKKAVADAKPAHVDRPVKEHPAAAAAPPAAQAAATAPGAPPKEKPTIRFADVRKTPRYEPKAGGEAGAPPVPHEPAPPSIAAEPARAESVRPAEPPRAVPEAAPAAASPAAPAAPQPLRYLELDGPIQVGDLAGRMGVPAGEVVKRLVEAGVMAGINHMIPLEIAGRVMAAFNFAPRAPERVEVTELAPTLETPAAEPGEQGRATRPPVVTVMGHVDHGKTSVRDAIRKTSV